MLSHSERLARRLGKKIDKLDINGPLHTERIDLRFDSQDGTFGTFYNNEAYVDKDLNVLNQKLKEAVRVHQEVKWTRYIQYSLESHARCDGWGRRYWNGVGKRPEEVDGVELSFGLVDVSDPFKLEPGQNSTQAMLVRFSARIDYDKEHGYRQKEMMIYGPSNYVQVWERDCWDVIPLEDMEEDPDDSDEMVPRKGKDYVKGQTEWKLLSDHDSCWREGVQQFLSRNRAVITGLNGLPQRGWYYLEDPPANLSELKRKQRG